MQPELLVLVPLALGLVAGVLALVVGVFFARRAVARAQVSAREILVEARADAESKSKELIVSAQERMLAVQEEADGRERELHEREAALDQRSRKVESRASELGQQRKRLDRRATDLERTETAASAALTETSAARDEARAKLEHVAGLTADQARAELIAGIEEDARTEAARMARKIEDEARESAEREAIRVMVQASLRVNIREVVESTVSFIELPSDEMKGRIIGREGRNIRALEMATGIDLIVDDTPRSILISSFDPVRREVARVAIDRLVEDGRIHPARIEEVVERVSEEMEELTREKGAEAAYGLGVSDLHPKLVGLVGRMRFSTVHGQNLLQHCLETALIGSHMALEVGARPEVALRAGLLHEVGQIDEAIGSHPLLAAAELCSRCGESDEVVDAIRCLHPDAEARGIEALLVNAANRMSENRPGARKENLAVYIERLRRLEAITTGIDGVRRAFAVKAGKEIRVIVDAEKLKDSQVQALSKKIARALERELSYSGQIKVSVVRETRAVRYAV